ncbi:MAG: ABC transporter substrate-binding protein [Alphaproteobacteria bacterium]
MPANKITTTRREFMVTAAVGTAAAAGIAGFPHIARAADPVKIGIVHPVTGWAQYSGSQCRFGAQMALDEINAAGGIKSLGGAMLEPVLGDAQSKAEVGAAEVEKFNEAGVASIVGAYASNICLATTQAAAKHGIPHVVDVGVNDKIVSRGLENTFRFGPGFGIITKAGVEGFLAINKAAGSPTKTVAIVHEETTGFGAGIAGLMTDGLKPAGIKVVEVLAHPTPHKDFRNIALKLKEIDPDVVIPSHYYGEGVLFLRTLQRQKIQPKAIYSVLGGASSQYRFLSEFPDAAQYVMDCNHWFDPGNAAAIALREKTQAANLHFNYEVFLAYTAMMFTADAIERAGSADRAKIIEAMASSDWSDHIMPYGATKIVNGQNEAARPLVTQVLGTEIEVIEPSDYATKAAVFPRPA